MPRDPFARYRANPSKLIGTFWYESSVSSGSRFASTFHRLFHLVAIVGKSGVLVEQGLTMTELSPMPFRVPVTQLLGEHCKYRFLGNIRRYSMGTFVVERLTSIPQVWCIGGLFPQGPMLRQVYEASGGAFNPTEQHTFNWDGFVFGWRVANAEERRFGEEAEAAREAAEDEAFRVDNERAREAGAAFTAEVAAMAAREATRVAARRESAAAMLRVEEAGVSARERLRDASAEMAALFAGVQPIWNPTGSLVISPEPTPVPSAWERLGREED